MDDVVVAEDPRTFCSDRSEVAPSTPVRGERGCGRHGCGRGRRRGERGATLVEYALLVALIAIPTITAISTLQHTSKITIEDTAARISTRAAPGEGG